MKITGIFLHYFPRIGGAERDLHKKLSYLASKGHEVEVLCFMNGIGTPFDKYERIEMDGIIIHQLKHRPIRKEIQDWIVKSDVVFTILFASPNIVSICNQYAIPVVNFVCDEMCFSNSIIRQSILKSQIIIANSEYTKNRIAKILLRESFVSFPFFNKEEKCKGTALPKKVALFFNPVMHKGYGIVKHLIKKFKDIDFYIVGTDDFDPLSNCSIEKVLQTNVFYLQCTEDQSVINSLYKDSFVVLVPSQVPETFSMVTAEAIWRHVPVIASNYGALPETVGNAGILVDKFNSEEEWEKSFQTIINGDKKDFDFNSQIEYYNKNSNEETFEKYIVEKVKEHKKNFEGIKK
jgi:glycosyltransferase involved in cell wall biosynthesis